MAWLSLHSDSLLIIDYWLSFAVHHDDPAMMVADARPRFAQISSLQIVN